MMSLFKKREKPAQWVGVQPLVKTTPLIDHQIFVQFTPIPFAVNGKAIDELPDDVVEGTLAFVAGEKKALCEWVGVPYKERTLTPNISGESPMLGFKTAFCFLFTVPPLWRGKDKTGIKERHPEATTFLGAFEYATIYGDTGTTYAGQSFAQRGRWVLPLE